MKSQKEKDDNLSKEIIDEVQILIEKYKLKPHPEGGYFNELYRSEQLLTSPVNDEKRNAITHIHFLLKKGQISRFHKVLHDEVWNFYAGDPLKLIEFNGNKVQETIIGQGDYFKVIKGGIFQAAETNGIYSLVGCSVAPGFDFNDFSFTEDDAVLLEKLRSDYPSYEYMV